MFRIRPLFKVSSIMQLKDDIFGPSGGQDKLELIVRALVMVSSFFQVFKFFRKFFQNFANCQKMIFYEKFKKKIKVVNQSKHRLAVLPIGEFTPIVQFNDD